MKIRNRIWLYLAVAVFFFFIVSYGCKKNDKSTDTPGNDTTVTDLEKNTYKIVNIGSQVWMAENLRSKKFQNGDAIPTKLGDVSGEVTPEYQWAYEADENFVPEYGRLYTWYTVADSRNLCPLNWHVPSDAEWETLKTFIGGESSGNKLKEVGISHWQSPNAHASNETGFTALPGGYRTVNGQFVSLHLSSYLWSSSQDSLFGLGQGLHFDDSLIAKGGYYRAAGVSVRCIKNN